AWDSLLPLNLRVLALTLLTLVFAARVNLLCALNFSPTLVWLFTLAVSQAQHWRRVQEDFRLALACRSPGPPGLRARLRASAAAAAWFIDQAIAAAREQAQALRARGLIR
ncbi:MAG: ABC transporter permease, partial [Burkholderiaceae bacterium]|nr:ABC transporter permease [Burkholderiaceae bacterium]